MTRARQAASPPPARATWNRRISSQLLSAAHPADRRGFAGRRSATAANGEVRILPDRAVLFVRVQHRIRVNARPPDTAKARSFPVFSFIREVLGSMRAREALRETNHGIGSQEAW